MANDSGFLSNIPGSLQKRETLRRIPTPEWRERLRTNDKGAILPTVSNALVIFSNDSELKGLLAYNEFSSRDVITRSPPSTEGSTTPGPFPRPEESADESLCLAYLQRVYSHRFSMTTIQQAMAGAAIACRFHPVRDYLDSLQWDGIPRIGHWLSDVFGADVTPYHHAVGTKFLCAAVQRIRNPGCKFDAILILEGPQGAGKSRACRALFKDEWFTDNLPADLTGRHISDALQGMWGIEFAEIQHFLRSDPEASKAFLTRQVDRYHPIYGRRPVERPRQCVFMGTTNVDDYARDSTGNRRLWPVLCKFANVDYLFANRDQLWAEASVKSCSEVLWLDDDSAEAEAIEQQASRHEDDPWEDAILEFVIGRSFVTVPEILTSALTVPKERQGRGMQMRVAAVLRRSGWKKDRKGERRTKGWAREMARGGPR